MKKIFVMMIAISALSAPAMAQGWVPFEDASAANEGRPPTGISGGAWVNPYPNTAGNDFSRSTAASDDVSFSDDPLSARASSDDEDMLLRKKPNYVDRRQLR